MSILDNAPHCLSQRGQSIWEISHRLFMELHAFKAEISWCLDGAEGKTNNWHFSNVIANRELRRIWCCKRLLNDGAKSERSTRRNVEPQEKKKKHFDFTPNWFLTKITFPSWRIGFLIKICRERPAESRVILQFPFKSCGSGTETY